MLTSIDNVKEINFEVYIHEQLYTYMDQEMLQLLDEVEAFKHKQAYCCLKIKSSGKWSSKIAERATSLLSG